MDSCLKNTYAQVRMTFSNILYVFEYAHVIASSFSQSENIKYSNVVILGVMLYPLFQISSENEEMLT